MPDHPNFQGLLRVVDPVNVTGFSDLNLERLQERFHHHALKLCQTESYMQAY
jgi:hypothetical protein